MRAKQWRQGLLLGVFAVAALWLVTSIWSLTSKTIVAVSEAKQAEARYEALQDRRAALAANLAALDTPRGRDAAIRTAFGVARPGEEVVVVVPPVVVATATEPLPWWWGIVEWFR